MDSNVALIVRLANNTTRGFGIGVSRDSTIAEFKHMIYLASNIPVCQQLLFQGGHTGQYLQDDRTIRSYGLQDGHTLYLIRRFVPPTSSPSASVAVASPVGGTSTPNILSGDGSVHILGVGGGNTASLSAGVDGIPLDSSDGINQEILINVQNSSETRFTIQVRPELTVHEIKGLISELQNIPVTEQRLIYCGQFLQDDKAIGSYGVQDGHVIHLAHRIVARSSARASVAATAVPSFQQPRQQMHRMLYREGRRNHERTRETPQFTGRLNPLPTRRGTNTVTAEEQYANQLFQLHEMGFPNTSNNIRALVITGGNVRAAVEVLGDPLSDSD